MKHPNHTDVIKRNNVQIKGKGWQTMILAHGFGCDHNMWRHVAPAFEDEYRVILFDNAGAIYQPDSISRAEALGLRARAMLDNNDGYGFFSALGDLVVTGPTRTKVNDFRAILMV